MSLAYGRIAPATYPRLAHLRRHVAHVDWPVLELVLEPLTFPQIAERLGQDRQGQPVGVRVVDTHWRWIREAMQLPARHGGSPVGRLRLLRIALGLDPCWCDTKGGPR